MATPLSASRQLAALRAEGCKVSEYRNWRTHNRNHKGAWGPVNGVMIHHTVTKGTDASVALCYDGHSTLPGPLCHTVGAKDGTLHMVGHGRANHAGNGDDDVLQAVIAELKIPADNEANVDGNRHFYGLEMVNLGDGRDPWPEAQIDAAARWAAAHCRAHGWNERSVIGHLEWQPGKIDPRGFTMDSFRARVKTLLAAKPGTTTPPPVTAPSPEPKPAPKPAPAPKPSTGSPARYQVTINGLTYGYGATGAHVTRVGAALVARGYGRHYRSGPGPNWSDADTRNYADYQRSLGYKGADADGVPGRGSLATLLGSLPVKPKPRPSLEPFPGASFFHAGRHSKIVTAMGRRLVAEGCGQYRNGPGPNWTEADRRSYAAWQRKLGYSGSAADGIPGRTSWSKLRVPNT